MQTRTLFTASSLYMGAVGLALMAVPMQFGIGAVPGNASSELIALLRLLGGPFLGISLLNWLARRETEDAPLRPILIANFIGFLSVAANDLVGVISGTARPVAAYFLVVHAVFALAFGYAWRRRGFANGPPDPR